MGSRDFILCGLNKNTFKGDYSAENYVMDIMHKCGRSAIAQLRIGILSLNQPLQKKMDCVHIVIPLRVNFTLFLKALNMKVIETPYKYDLYRNKYQ